MNKLILQTMKKSVYKTGMLFAIAVLIGTIRLDGQELNKDFHKEYTYSAGKTLDLNNRYGDVIVETSETDQVVIDVKVTLRFPNRERAEKLLSYINVEFSESENTFSAKTVIDDKFNFTGWGGDSRRFSIDYTVKMPEKMDLILVNRYGNSELDNLSGRVSVDIRYGNLNAVSFSRGNIKPINKVVLSYGKASIDEVNWLEAVVRYSGSFAVTSSQAILLDSKYSTVELGTTSSVVAETRYDKLRISDINNLVLDAGYTDIDITSLTKKLVFEGGYGSFTVERVESDFESIDVESKYMGVSLGIDPSANYKLDARVSYGGLKFDEENFQHRRHIVQNNSTETAGVVGKAEDPSASVKILASYGTVRLN